MDHNLGFVNRFKSIPTRFLNRFRMAMNQSTLSSEPIHAFGMWVRIESGPVKTTRLRLWTGSTHLFNRFNKNLFWCDVDTRDTRRLTIKNDGT